MTSECIRVLVDESMQPLEQTEKTSYLPAFKCRIVAACRLTRVASTLCQYAGVAPRGQSIISMQFAFCYATVISVLEYRGADMDGP